MSVRAAPGVGEVGPGVPVAVEDDPNVPVVIGIEVEGPVLAGRTAVGGVAPRVGGRVPTSTKVPGAVVVAFRVVPGVAGVGPDALVVGDVGGVEGEGPARVGGTAAGGAVPGDGGRVPASWTVPGAVVVTARAGPGVGRGGADAPCDVVVEGEGTTEVGGMGAGPTVVGGRVVVVVVPRGRASPGFVGVAVPVVVAPPRAGRARPGAVGGGVPRRAWVASSRRSRRARRRAVRRASLPWPPRRGSSSAGARGSFADPWVVRPAERERVRAAGGPGGSEAMVFV